MDGNQNDFFWWAVLKANVEVGIPVTGHCNFDLLTRFNVEGCSNLFKLASGNRSAFIQERYSWYRYLGIFLLNRGP